MLNWLLMMRNGYWFLSALCLIGLVSSTVLQPQWVAVAHADDDNDDDGGGDDDDDDDDNDDDRPERSKPPARSELVAIGLSDDALARLSGRGYRILAQSQSGLMNRPVARLLAPPGRSFAASLRDVQREDLTAVVAQNDLYRRHQFTRYLTEGGGCGETCPAFAMTQWLPEAGKCSSRITIGLIDTGVDLGHPSLGGAKITGKALRRLDRAPSDQAHGTGVASLLAGRPGSSVRGVIPDASIFAADAFHKAGGNDAADAFDLVAALDWLAGSGATVINMSLSGPPNKVLQQAIDATLAKGVSIVAAAGKASTSATGYPARYPGVIAVTGVDGRLLYEARIEAITSRSPHLERASLSQARPVRCRASMGRPSLLRLSRLRSRCTHPAKSILRQRWSGCDRKQRTWARPAAIRCSAGGWFNFTIYRGAKHASCRLGPERTPRTRSQQAVGILFKFLRMDRNKLHPHFSISI